MAPELLESTGVSQVSDSMHSPVFDIVCGYVWRIFPRNRLKIISVLKRNGAGFTWVLKVIATALECYVRPWSNKRSTFLRRCVISGGPQREVWMGTCFRLWLIEQGFFFSDGVPVSYRNVYFTRFSDKKITIEKKIKTKQRWLQTKATDVVIAWEQSIPWWTENHTW